MKEYRVHFSFYSEQFGDFEEMDVKVDAENQFEARRKAWALCETDEDMKFASNLRVCGVTWNANQESAANYERSGDGTIAAENPITGEIAEWKRTDFLGVLRPEKSAKIDYEALKNEYLTLTAAQDKSMEDGEDFEMEA